MNLDFNHIIWNDIAPLRKLLENPGKRMVIMIHVNPDGDALGSSLGLLQLMEKLGHSCSVISPNDYPEFLKWMPGTDRVIIMESSPAMAEETLHNADVIFAVDFNDLSRVKKLNAVVAASPAYKVLIDHHPNPDIKADCILSDISSSSTAELTFRFIREAGMSSMIDKDMASCLFVCLSSKTL